MNPPSPPPLPPSPVPKQFRTAAQTAADADTSQSWENEGGQLASPRTHGRPVGTPAGDRPHRIIPEHGHGIETGHRFGGIEAEEAPVPGGTPRAGARNPASPDPRRPANDSRPPRI